MYTLIFWLKGENTFVVKIGKKIGTHPSANVSVYALRARSVSLTRKIMATLSKLLLQMVKHFHTGNHVKTTESEDAHTNEGR